MRIDNEKAGWKGSWLVIIFYPFNYGDLKKGEKTKKGTNLQGP